MQGKPHAVNPIQKLYRKKSTLCFSIANETLALKKFCQGPRLRADSALPDTLAVRPIYKAVRILARYSTLKQIQLRLDHM